MVDQTYTLTQDAKSYSVAQFTANPSYCPLDYSYTYEKLDSGETAVTLTGERAFSIEYN